MVDDFVQLVATQLFSCSLLPDLSNVIFLWCSFCCLFPCQFPYCIQLYAETIMIGSRVATFWERATHLVLSLDKLYACSLCIMPILLLCYSSLTVDVSHWGFRGAVAWWLIHQTPDPEVGGSSPTRVKPCCVLEQGTFNPQKYW